ncbi:MAG TPA: DEAD/DEAH box helicase, partial [Saprospiraceae bacterium]|nr:DEAD/DEAH box helicase [Saprospiraceae bacterium]
MSALDIEVFEVQHPSHPSPVRLYFFLICTLLALPHEGLPSAARRARDRIFPNHGAEGSVSCGVLPPEGGAQGLWLTSVRFQAYFSSMSFHDLSLIEPLLRALQAEGYEHPTPIQQQAIPIVLDRRDLLGCAQTGTGKTAAFALPMLQTLFQTKPPQQPQQGKTRPIRALILTPTRELAIQIGESFDAYGRHLPVRNLVIFGGVGQTPQTDALRKGTDVLIATPGRLLDLINQGFISLRDIEIFVLDEADRMLDMGFIHDVKKVIAKLPSKRQTLFFSATMPPEIASLAESILTDRLRRRSEPRGDVARAAPREPLVVRGAEVAADGARRRDRLERDLRDEVRERRRGPELLPVEELVRDEAERPHVG